MPETEYNRSAFFRRVLLDTVPVMTGYIVMGMAFGILLEDGGYSFLWAVLMSVFVYAGSLQFVGVGILSGGATVVSTALISLMVNARHIFYGITMLAKYRDMGKVKPYLIFALTDETFALLCRPVPDGMAPKKYYFAVSLFNQCYWVIGSLMGGLIGTAITFDTTGIDFAMTALFVVIFTEQIMTASSYLPAVTGLASSVACLLVFGPDRFLIPSMIVISAVLSFAGFRKRGAADD